MCRCRKVEQQRRRPFHDAIVPEAATTSRRLVSVKHTAAAAVSPCTKIATVAHAGLIQSVPGLGRIGTPLRPHPAGAGARERRLHPLLRPLIRRRVVLPIIGAAVLAATLSEPLRAANGECVPVAAWVAPGGKRLDATGVLARAAKSSVVLLGESHDNAEHHRWQLQTIAALHAARPDMVLAFEAFARRVQPVLERWVAGELSETEFLAQTDWRNAWRFDPQLYLPLFHFARMNRIPMVALNVEPSLTREIAQKGYDGVPPERREGIGRPAPPTGAYLDWLLPVWAEHERPGGKPANPDRNDPEFRRFVESQQVWDRAMAEALSTAAKRPGAPLVVGIMGTGHIRLGHGVPHQLQALGVASFLSLLPWDRSEECKNLVPGLADAVFGLDARSSASAADRPRLGVTIETTQEGVRILRVEKGSIAEAAGIRVGDVVSEIADAAAKTTGDMIEVVQRQAPGTWLPLKVRRGGERLELVAKFPARPK